MSEAEILATLRRIESKVNWIQGRLNYMIAQQKIKEDKKDGKII